MIPRRSWQDHSKEICMICAIIWSDYDRPGWETRVVKISQFLCQSSSHLRKTKNDLIL